MAWIRLDDDYIYHPKFAVLGDRAFRLWHEGMAYCRKMLTDGLIPTAALKTFRYASRGIVAELTTSIGEGIAPLWETHDVGFKVHDYLVWNRSREQELKDRDEAKERAHVSRTKRAHNSERAPHGTGHVLNMDKEEGSVRRTVEKKIEGSTAAEQALDLRAGDLVNRYAELFTIHRKGARYHNRMHFDFPKACELVRTWPDDARLEKLAVLVLTTDDDWVSGTDRGFGIFAAKASWADGLLAEWEAKQKATA